MFVSFEGIDASGKTTVMHLLAAELASLGHTVLETREPGGCDLGVRLRSIVLDERTAGLSPRAELFLFLADRAQHVETVIAPGSAEGIVLCDRYTDSTLAYQGYGRGLPLEELVLLNRQATGGLVPDLTFLFDLPVETALARMGRRHGAEGEGRFDRETVGFHERVRAGYLALARREARFRVIDAAQPVETVVAACIKHFVASGE